MSTLIICHGAGNFRKARRKPPVIPPPLDRGHAAVYLSAMERTEWDEEADATGLLCPLPVLRARKRLKGMAAGGVLRLVTTDPAARVDVAHFCAEAGHELLGEEAMGAATAWLIRKRG